MPDSSGSRELKPQLSTPFGTSSQFPIAVFLDCILPPIRGPDPVTVINDLKRTGNKSQISHNRWQGFPKDPAKTRQPEQHSFVHIADVVHAIQDAARRFNDSESSVYFQNNPACVMASAERNWDTFPDAYLSYRSESARSWADIVVSGEYKKTDSEDDKRDNIIKITASMSNCMRNDPSRRFALGFTIENAHMRLWFCDRSQMAISEPFNFIADHRTVVHFFLSVLYAEKHELGYDPTMSLLSDGRYDITIYPDDKEPLVYRTVETLSESSVDILGRGTRVWKAVKIEDGKECGEPVALKDAWVDVDHTSEGTILESFRDTERTDSNQTVLNLTFMTPLWHGDVYLDPKKTVLDHTRSIGSRDSSLAILDIRKGGPQSANPSGSALKNCRVHYRIVFKEVCRPITHEPSLAKVFKALLHITAALQVMHESGWIHRDVSVGNILFHDDGYARLGDLEYAKEAGQGSEFCIGTAPFMAVEVDSQEYMFLSGEPYSPRPAPDFSMSEIREAAHRQGVPVHQLIPSTLGRETLKEALEKTPPQPLPPPFKYNALHDLESLWWVAVFFIVKRQILVGGHPIPISSTQRAYAAALFSNINKRISTITKNNYFAIDVELLPEPIRPMARDLVKLRNLLRSFYIKAERDPTSITNECARGLHCEFADVFRKISNAEENSDMTIQSFPSRTVVRQPEAAAVDGLKLRASQATPPEETDTAKKPKESSTPGDFEQKPPLSDVVAPPPRKPTNVTKKQRPKKIEGVRTRPFLPRKAKSAKENK